MATPKTLLLKKSFQIGVFPTIWKNGFVTPVLKKGINTLLKIIDPFLSNLSKIIEKIVYDSLTCVESGNPFIVPH